ncbi:hypothetical protein pipiens_011164 [Culex pipiens pipiens]|uniref:Reverse transcriptase domain-containing protein n=1 Tax=Culex pipiens pipiens TaxID=38569 RepID=A0ABD1DAM5_CULPP
MMKMSAAFFPQTRRRIQRTPPWWNAHLRNLRNQLRKARKRFLLRSSWGNKVTLSYLETEFAEQQDTSYRNYFAGVQDSLQSNPKNFWSYVKERKQVGEIPTEMSYREEKSTSPEAAANLFARFFESVHSPTEPTVTAEQLNELVTFNINLPLLTVSVAEVKTALSSVDAAKGPGPDRIPPSVVKKCCNSLARPVTSIFNRSLSEGVFPSEWKVASIAPIHKSGSRSKIENYRSISILNCLAKILEKFLVDHIYPSVKNIVSEFQHGFMKQRSTTSNLMAYTNWIIRRMEKRQQVDAIYVDFAKAFDRVPHKLTIAKLTALGLPDWVTRWLNSYLSNRSAYVKVAGFLSSGYNIHSGVPQGSHLGPLFINDLCSRLQSSKLLYADDLKIFRQISDAGDVRAHQNDINKLLRWCAQNGMEVNEKKCKLISFYRIRRPILADADQPNEDHIYNTSKKLAPQPPNDS